MADDSHAVDADLELGSTVATLAALTGAVFFADPLGAVLVGAGGTTVAVAAQTLLRKRIRRRVDLMEETVNDLAGKRLPDLIERVSVLEPSAALAALALQTSGAATTDGQAVACGRLLVHGVLAQREPESEFLIRVLARLGETELRALAMVAELGPDEQNRGGLRAGLSNDIEVELVEPVLASLSGVGLIDLDPPGFPGVWITPLGTRVVSELKAAGPTD